MKRLNVVIAAAVGFVGLVSQNASAVPLPAGYPDVVTVTQGSQSWRLYYDQAASFYRYDADPVGTASPFLQQAGGGTVDPAHWSLYSAGNVYQGDASFNASTGTWSAPGSWTISHGNAWAGGFAAMDLVAAVVTPSKFLLLGGPAAVLLVWAASSLVKRLGRTAAGAWR